jgi:hypothetical protein
MGVSNVLQNLNPLTSASGKPAYWRRAVACCATVCIRSRVVH